MAGGEHYRRYVNDGVTLYYIISKENPDDDKYGKMAIALWPESDEDKFTTEDDYAVECFDAQDDPMDFYEILDITGLDENLFKSNPNELSVYEKLNLDESKITHNPDGSIDYDGNVNLSNSSFVKSKGKIPIKFRKVTGYFVCDKNDLTTLENCPEEVGGSFGCNYNRLTSLEHGPKIVGRSYYCSYNKLTTLKGCVREVNGNFYCNLNKLTTLEYAPKLVGVIFDCGENPNLVSLRKGPEKVRNFLCYDVPKLPDSEKRWAEKNIEARVFKWER